MIYLVFVILLKFVSANVTSKLIEEAVFISNKYYRHQFVTSVIWTNGDSEGVDDFLFQFSGSVVITPLSDTNNEMILHTKKKSGYAQTIFFANNSSEFKKLMLLLNHNLRYPMRLILVLKTPVKLIEISTFAEIAWNYNLADIVIISQNNYNEITLSTYFPYSNGICGNFVPVPLTHEENMFPNKFYNFNQCPLRISAVSFPPYVNLVMENGTLSRISGYDGKALTLIKETMNATLNFTVVSDGLYGSSTNGNATGVFRDLVRNKSDMVIPSGYLNLGRYSVTRTSKVFREVDIRWIGPKRREAYHWIKVLIPFINIVTPFLCLAFILFVVVALLIKSRKSHRKGKKKSICFQTFSLLVGQTVNFVTKVPLLNNLFLIWIWFCVIIRIKYQGDLIESLQNEILEPPFNSMEEAMTVVGRYGGTEVLLDFYRGTPIEQNYNILSLKEYNEIIKRISEGERFLLVSDTFLVQRIRNSIQVLDGPVGTTWSCYYMRPGWPAARAVSSIVLRLQETGFIANIFRMDIEEYKQEIKAEQEEDTKAHPLDSLMFTACYYAMGFSWVMCSLIFFIEIIYYKYIECKKNF